jgi:hypothetical protein
MKYAVDMDSGDNDTYTESRKDRLSHSEVDRRIHRNTDRMVIA